MSSFLRPPSIFILGLTTEPVLKSLVMGIQQLNNDDSEFYSLNPDGPPNRYWHCKGQFLINCMFVMKNVMIGWFWAMCGKVSQKIDGIT